MSKEVLSKSFDASLDSIKKTVSESFEELDFIDARHPKDQTEYIDEITVSVKSVELTEKELVCVEKESAVFALTAKIKFSAEGTSPDFDMSYNDPDTGDFNCLEYVNIPTNLEIFTFPITIEVAFEANNILDTFEIEEVRLNINEPIPLVF